MVDKKVLMILAIVAVGLFAMPNILAAYAGTHTLEIGEPNSTKGSAKALDCRECHQYIYDAATTGSKESNKTYSVHRLAGLDTDYTTFMRMYGTNFTRDVNKAKENGDILGDINDFNGVNVSNQNYTAFFAIGNSRGDAVIGQDIAVRYQDGDWYPVNRTTGALTGSAKKATEVYPDVAWAGCLLCHQAPTGTHSRLEVKGCTNDYCHGNAASASIGYDVLGKKSLKAGHDLIKDQDAHSSWYDRSGDVHDNATAYGQGSTSTKDYYTCLGCHSHAEVNLEIIKSTGYNATVRTTRVDYVAGDNTTTLTSTKLGGAFKNVP